MAECRLLFHQALHALAEDPLGQAGFAEQAGMLQSRLRRLLEVLQQVAFLIQLAALGKLLQRGLLLIPLKHMNG